MRPSLADWHSDCAARHCSHEKTWLSTSISDPQLLDPSEAPTGLTNTTGFGVLYLNTVFGSGCSDF